MLTKISNYLRAYKFPLLIGLCCAIMYWSFGFELERSDFIKLITLYGALFFLTHKLIQIYGWNFWLLAGMGLAFRVVLLTATPNLSQDFYRFLWDGRLLVQGISPYLTTPQMYMDTGELVVSQMHELHRGMGSLNASHFSNYPPVNQLCFTIAALFAGKSITGSIVVLKIITISADIGILYFGKKLLEKLQMPVKNIFWYFLNPFIILELTGNLHFEGVMLFFLIGALYLLIKGKWLLAALLLGISISVKLLPLLLLPLLFQWFVKRENVLHGIMSLSKFYLVTMSVVFLSFLPFLSSEFLENFWSTISLWFQDFEFNASVYYIIRWIGFQTVGWNPIETVGKVLPLVVILFIIILSFFRRKYNAKGLITTMLFGISFYFLLSTTVHPWYIATPLVISIFTRYRFPIVWSLMVMLSYAAYTSAGFSENLWLVLLEYSVVIGYAIWEISKPNKNEGIKLV